MSDKWGISLSVKFQGTEDLKTYVIGGGGGEEEEETERGEREIDKRILNSNPDNLFE